ncbi:hybrid sensor histidine kinase/response regulator [Ramlibacter algicola]|uniref:histidine kinase n=1 Tax=Ramlibacter algicola TaxID=2795217 RepID=A0A934UQZ8_9BURK|nr:hybrid sensor histidine kinase/response regulator [Ramlibacter algicola]MBK0392032.1 hybrid sensor histidine kinase/response regulator [Ramlibacter algicola]
MDTPSRAASTVVADEMVVRSVGILLRQTRAGATALGLLCGLYGVILVPAVGWLAYLGWYAVLVASLVARQVYFSRLAATRGPTRETLRHVAIWTTITGCLPSACIPMFVQSLSLADVGVLTVTTLGTLAAAVAVIGVQPRLYAFYLVTSLAFAYTGWLWHAGPNERVMIGLAMVMGGFMLQRAVWTYYQQLRENVEITAHNAELVEQLRTSLEREQDIRRARSRFLGAASHDLRQPVQALLFLADIFRRSSDGARREQIAQQIVRTGESIDTMFRHLVDFAQIDAGTMKANLQPVQLPRLVQATVSGFGEKCAAKGLHFRLEVEPEGAVTADPVLLERLLRNFLDNACKYSLQGEITLRIHAIGDHLEIEVVDQGVGMDDEDLALVWNAFQRGRSASRAEAEGIGLGLAICRHMADLMGTELQLASRPGQGTRVTLRLPLLRNDSASPGPGRSQQQLALQGRVIALVENDRLAREALSAWLREAGAIVASGSDLAGVQQALRQVGGALHCVIADYRLTNGNGMDVIRALRAQHGPVPALVVSGEPNLHDLALEVPCLQKPVAPDKLLEHLRRILPGAPATVEA